MYPNGSRAPSRKQCFLFIDMIFDDKVGWKELRDRLYRNLMTDPNYPRENKKRIQDSRDGLYETPKTYIDGIAYNDGSWLIYNTCRITGGKFRGKVLCKTKKHVIENIYGYMCFLRKVGVEERDELIFHTICYIIYKLVFSKGMFGSTRTNIDLLKTKTETVMKKAPDEVECPSRIDTRKFCMSPAILNTMTTAQKVKFEKTIQKKMTDDLISRWYNPEMSVRKNVIELNRKGVDIKKSRLEEWIQENR